MPRPRHATPDDLGPASWPTDPEALISASVELFARLADPRSPSERALRGSAHSRRHANRDTNTIERTVGGYTRHDLFEAPDSAAQIWRYVDFVKLVDLLDQGALFFSRADQMPDPWEGAISASIEDAHTADLTRQLDGLAATVDPPFAKVASTNVPPNLEPIRLERRRIREEFRTRTFLSCWHLSEFESAAMWDLYTRDGRGVAIQSSFGSMERALPAPWKYSLHAGKVSYIDYQEDQIPPGNNLTLFLHKRRSFAHEQELRALFNTHADEMPEPGVNVPVDLHELVQAVYVAPTEPTWVAEVVERTVRKWDAAVPVIHSDLLAGPIL